MFHNHVKINQDYFKSKIMQQWLFWPRRNILSDDSKEISNNMLLLVQFFFYFKQMYVSFPVVAFAQRNKTIISLFQKIDSHSYR